MSSSGHRSDHRSEHRSNHKKSSRSNNKEICVDNLFPSDNRSGTKGRKLDVESLFSGTPLNKEPDITFTSDILIERIKKRRLEKLLCYKNMLKYCHDRITSADEDQETDIIFTIVESVPECKEYDPQECLEYISVKLREEDFDTTVLTDTTMFITWRYLELKKEEKNNRELDNNYNKKNTENTEYSMNSVSRQRQTPVTSTATQSTQLTSIITSSITSPLSTDRLRSEPSKKLKEITINKNPSTIFSY